MSDFGNSPETGEVILTTDLLTCKKCGWSFFKVSKEFMTREIKKFLDFYNSADDETKSHYGNVTPERMLDEYTKCALCNSSHKNMRPYDSKQDNNLEGHTIGPMLDPEEDV